MNARSKILLGVIAATTVGLAFVLGWVTHGLRVGPAPTPMPTGERQPSGSEVELQRLAGEIEQVNAKLDQVIADQRDQNQSQQLHTGLEKLTTSVTELREQDAQVLGQVVRIRAVTESLLAASQLRYQNLVASGIQQFIARDFEKAIAEFSAAIEVDPRGYMAHINRGAAHQELGNWGQALADFERASQLDADNYVALNNAAWIRATCPQDEFRNGELAVKLAERACEMTEWKKPITLTTLAAAHAEQGEFELAVQRQRQALEADADTETKKKMSMYLKRFESGQPYRIGVEQAPPNAN